MYELIFWMCLLDSPQCSPDHHFGYITTLSGQHSKDECETAWAYIDQTNPDPPGKKSMHVCRMMEEPL